MVERVFVIMPAYNAAKTISQVFARIPDEVKARIAQYVVVNDGSKDETSAVVRKLQQHWDKLVLIEHDRNKGYGGAEKTLLNHCLAEGADLAILLHSDGQYSPEKIPEILAAFDADETDILQGSRMAGDSNALASMPFYKWLANKSLTAIENWAFRLGLGEYHSGYMIYNRRAMETIPFNKLSGSFDFDLEMLVLAKVKGLRVKEMPIPTIYADEKSHLNPITYGFDVLGVVWDYKRGKYDRL
jgi:glycosyltransferase involved in cell wall biosynthesis